MDLLRTGVAEKKRRNRWLLGGAGVVAVILLTAAVASLEPAAPGVERDTVWIGTVERGDDNFDLHWKLHDYPLLNSPRSTPANSLWIVRSET